MALGSVFHTDVTCGKEWWKQLVRALNCMNESVLQVVSEVQGEGHDTNIHY